MGRKRKISAIDLFCGVGGLTHGLANAGIDVRLGIDIDPMCEFPYQSNNTAKFLLQSVENVRGEELKNAFGKYGLKLLAGCAPCQTFSTYNQKAKSTDKRWWLLKSFSKLIQDIDPELVTMENVPGLTKQRVFADFVRRLEKAGFYVNYQVVNCAEYGIPQTRHRLVLLASKLGPVNLLAPEQTRVGSRSVREAIGRLPRIEAGEAHRKDPLHTSAILSELNLRRIKASKPGGTWRDWDRRLIADCHKKTTGKTYPSVYGRMSWDEPAPTITTQFFGYGNGRFGHPEQNRAISLREGAILQSFPPDYAFTGPGEEVFREPVGRLIGNAVPVKLGEIIGKSLLTHMVESHV